MAQLQDALNPLQVAALAPMALAPGFAGSNVVSSRVCTPPGQNPQRAIVLEPGGKLARFVYDRLERTGALQPAGNDRYYLDEAAYGRFRGRSRKRALLILGVALLAVLILFFRGEFS